jgi:hypothetical protein
METELSTKWRLEQICERLGIERSTYYKRLKYLEIEPSRDDEGPYLTQHQMKEMDELNEHIKRTGKTRGFREGGELAISENSGLASALEVPEVELPEVEANFAQMDDESLGQLIEEAGDLKTQQIAMPHLVRLHLANSMTEEDLSDEQRAKLEAIRNAANPKPNAAASIAQQLLQRHRQKQQKNQEPQ